MPSVTCKGCGNSFEVCPCHATNLQALAAQGELTRALAEENAALKVRIEDLEAAVSAARPAVKWVVDHWGRTEPALAAHDKSHAESALKALQGARSS